MISPEDFIKDIRSTFGRYPDGSKGCLKFAVILAELYGGYLYYNSNHVICRIGGSKFYDIDGLFSLDRDDNGMRIDFGYLPASSFGVDHFMKSFDLDWRWKERLERVM